MNDEQFYFKNQKNYRIQEVLTYPTNNKMKVELIEEQKYNEVVYWIKIDDTIVAMKTTYEAAKEEFDKAVTYEPRQTILESKEI